MVVVIWNRSVWFSCCRMYVHAYKTETNLNSLVLRHHRCETSMNSPEKTHTGPPTFIALGKNAGLTRALETKRKILMYLLFYFILVSLNQVDFILLQTKRVLRLNVIFLTFRPFFVDLISSYVSAVWWWCGSSCASHHCDPRSSPAFCSSQLGLRNNHQGGNFSLSQTKPEVRGLGWQPKLNSEVIVPILTQSLFLGRHFHLGNGLG